MDKRFLSLVLVLICSFGFILTYPSKRPIIGIVLEATDLEYEVLCHSLPGQRQAMQSTYKSYIEQAGGGTVPIFVDQPAEYYDKLLRRINGVLIPGGGVDLINSYYGKVAKTIFQYGKSANDANRHFPIWGTCLGMQEMTTWPFNPRTDPMSTCNGTLDISLPLNFTEHAKSSRMYRNLPEKLLNGLSRYALTPNYHAYCLTMNTYNERRELSDFYMVTTTNNDKSGLLYASTIEARDYPFYGIQWHPEKNNFWPVHNHLNQSALAVEVSQYFANFLVNEASKNNNSFMSYEEEGRFLFNNYPTKFNPKTQDEYYCLRKDEVPKFDDNHY